MQAHQAVLAMPVKWGMLDEVLIEPSGLVRVHGWSRMPSPAIEAPELTVNGKTIPLIAVWRYFRLDVSNESTPFGIAFQFLVDPPTMSDCQLSLGGRRLWDCDEPVSFRHPDYASLLSTDRVLGRENIYGSGPPVPMVDPEVAMLTAVINGRCLDFGCGAGALVAHLRGRGVDAFGIEIDRPAIRDSLLPEAHTFIRLYGGGQLPYDAKAFDWVTAVEVIEHVPDFREALNEFARVGENLVMTVPDMSAIPALHRHGVVPWHLLESTHVNFFTQRSLESELRRHYSQIDIVRLGRFSVNGTEIFTSLAAVCRRD